MPDRVGAVLVLGAGVAGLRAALDLAESGFKAYLVDTRPGIGGTVPQLDKWFPDNGCELCKLLPVFSRDECTQLCLRREMAHPNIELLPYSSLTGLTGEAGNFKATIRLMSRWVKTERCTGCGLCAEVCPVEVPDEWNDGLTMRKAAYVRHPQAIPNFYAIDRDACTRCGKCVEVCPTNAIELEMKDTNRQLEVGAVIVAAGFQEFDSARLGQYGFGRFDNVLTNLQVERLLSSGGRTAGELRRPSDGKVPRRVDFLQCVGSRDAERNYCSTACCMYALKEAILIKEKYPSTEVNIYYMDMRAFGKGYHRYYVKAQEMGINFIRSRVSAIKQHPRTKSLYLLARAEDGTLINAESDMVVLAAAQCPSARTAELARILGVETDEWGFIRTDSWYGTRTSQPGIYVCGSAAGPADISDSVIQASAAACEASTLLYRERSTADRPEPAPEEPRLLDVDPKTAVFICRCGQEIAAVVDTAAVADFVRGLPAVVSVEEVDFLCLPETLEHVRQSLAGSGANRVVFAACAPYYYQRLLGETMQQAGIERAWWQLVNIREQLAWVHKDAPRAATEKAKRIVAAAVDRLHHQAPLRVTPMPLDHTGLVIGSGISGMVAAISLAEQGFEAHLVERSPEPGGHTTGIHYTLELKEPQAFFEELRARVKTDPRVHFYPESEVVEVSGHTGDFRSVVRSARGGEQEIRHGAIIIATGAEDYVPTEYLYGQHERVITQKELQQRLAEGKLGTPGTVVMIQCVGSRDEEHPYCSRTCCSEAISNALAIKEKSPGTQVYILNRDIMTYGLREQFYTRAREAGVLFMRYHPDRKPQVTARGDFLLVSNEDPALPGRLDIEADLVVLSTGIVPGNNTELARLLSAELDSDGFFRDVDTKFRPVDTPVDGIFICGHANAPRNLDEEILQAQAAAQRAVNVLSRPTLRSGRVVSEVNARRCSACWLCIDTCPFKARRMDEDRHVAVVEEALCQGCGVCVALCPNSAARLRSHYEEQLFSAIETVL